MKDIRIGSKVRGKGLPGDPEVKPSGTVVALFHPEYFTANLTTENPELSWGQKYPDWKKKTVILVLYDKPERNFTLKEWVETANARGGRASLELIRKSYQDCPISKQIAFPYDDLELLA